MHQKIVPGADNNETSVITYKDVTEALTYCLKGKISDQDTLTNLIKEIVPRKTDFGSSRGYYTFLHTQYKNEIIDRFNYFTHKIDKK